MNRVPPEDKASPYGPAIFLLLAVAAGGLRSAPQWLVFAAAFLGWTLLKPGGLSTAGMRLPLLFFSWVGAAALFSPSPALSWAVFPQYALAGIFFYWALSCEEGGRAWLAAVYGIGAAAAAVLVFERLTGPELFGLIGKNPNYSAAFCAAAFPPALLALTGDRSRRQKVIFASLAVLLAAGIAASGSRGAALAAFAAAAAGLAFTRSWRFLAGLVLFALAGAAFLPSSVWEGVLKLSDPRAFARPRLWGAALQAAAGSPLLGWGPGNFGAAFELFKFPYFDGISYYGHSTLHAHSEILNLAAEGGFPAAVLFLAASFSALAVNWKERLPLKLSAMAVLIQGSVDMVFYSGAVSLLYWGSLGFSASGRSAPRGGRLLTVAAGFCLAGLTAAPVLWHPGGQNKFIAFSHAEPLPSGNLALGAALAKRRVLAGPQNPFAAAAEGRALAASWDMAGAEDAFRRALAIEPFYCDARLGLARLYYSAGMKDDACAELSAPGPGPGLIAVSPYQRGLLARAPDVEKIQKELCGKKKTGNYTAPLRRKPSKGTK